MPIGHRARTNIRGFPAFISHRAILTFMVPVPLNFIKVIYEGKPESPFDICSFTTSLAIFCLLFYRSLAHVARYPSLPLVMPEC